MSDEKPMTVKERMAALARANSGGQMPARLQKALFESSSYS